MKQILNPRGNAILTVMILGSLALGGLTLVVQLAGEANKAAVKVLQGSEGSSQDLIALSLLTEKFQLKGVRQGPSDGDATFFADNEAGVPPSGSQHPYLFVEPYPSLDELHRVGFKPVVGLYKPYLRGADLNPNLQTTTAPIGPIRLPLILVSGRINETTRICETLPTPVTRFTNQLDRFDCNYQFFSLDETRLLTLETRTQLTSVAEDFHRAFIAFPNISILPTALSFDLLAHSSGNLPTDALDNKLVSFLGVFPHPTYPRALKTLLVKVGTTTALLEMPLPPEPEGIFELAQGQSEPITLGTSVRLGFKTNSITISGEYADNISFRSPTQVTIPRQSAKNIQKYGFFEQASINLVAPRNLYTDPAYGPPRINPNNDLEGRWTIRGKVQGVRGRTSDFSKTLRVYPPPKPDCTLGFASDRYREGGKELLQGEQLTITINCNSLSSGHVNSAVIGGIPVSNFDNNPSSPKYKTGSVSYTRRNLTAAEYIPASATGPGGTWTGSTGLAAVCAFNDLSYQGSFDTRRWGIWPFSRTTRLLNNQLMTFETADWGGGWDAATIANWGYRKTCGRATGYCMATIETHNAVYTRFPQTCPRTCSYQYYDGRRQLQTAYYSCPYDCSYYAWIDPWTTDVDGNPVPLQSRFQNVNYVAGLSTPVSYNFGGREVWVDVGDRRDANCAPRDYAYRTKGCFTPDTLITMADGSHRKVSQINKNDLVLNPLYQVPIKVSKIVKGPEKKPLYQVKVEKNRLTVTEDHPFLTQRGWVRADNLSREDVLLGAGEPKKVSEVKKLAYKKPSEVYNFQLETDLPQAHVVIANGIPTGDLAVQNQLKNLKKLP